MKKGEFWKKLVLYEAGQQNQENLDVWHQHQGTEV
jgi:hypothetical protein